MATHTKAHIHYRQPLVQAGSHGMQPQEDTCTMYIQTRIHAGTYPRNTPTHACIYIYIRTSETA